MANILIVDDDAQLRRSFKKLLSFEGYNITTASSGEEALGLVKQEPPDLAILDVRLPGMSGLEAFEAIHEITPKLPVIIMTAYGTTDIAITATQLGAYDYVVKPFEIPDILNLIHEALEAGRLTRSAADKEAVAQFGAAEGLIGSSRAMNEVYKSIGKAAATDATVLIRGESGTGKELVARAIYQYSQRSDKPFMVINCVAIPEPLLESELFGYEKGAFTGAYSRRLGKIEQARGGTVFLDEIGDMPRSIQAKILRLLQERTVERLGGQGEDIPVDVRIIAATKGDLEAAIEAGQFREDLYYRLNVVTIRLPPLRERTEDIPLLAEYFLVKFSREMGIDNPGITEEAKALLAEHPWPGNVRELGNAIQKALIFSRGYPVRPEDIPTAADSDATLQDTDDGSVKEVIRRWIRKGLASGSGENQFDAFMDHFGSTIISEALLLTEGNRSRAAKLLGITRPTLQAKIEKYNLKIETSVTNG
jgi:DNA-binding NtrC family response regulator